MRLDVAAIAVMALHDADHLRQAIDHHYRLPIHVAAILFSAYLPLALSIWFARRGQIRAACLAAVPVLVGVLVLLSFVHLVGVAQIWSPLGDLFGMWGMSYFEMHVDALSWGAFALLAASYAWLLSQVVVVLRSQSASAVSR